jgi:hypothetical protein
MTNVTDLAARRAERAAAPTLDAINAMTVAASGWKRLDDQTMRYISEPIGGDCGGRDVLQLKGRGRGLAFMAALLPADVDPDDDQAVTDELEGEWESALPLPALIVLASALDMAIGVMEEVAAAKPKTSTPARRNA